jgi:hypothetical protein
MISSGVEPPVFDSYPHPDFIGAANVADHLEEEGDATSIIELRKQGVAVIRAEYWGGLDEPNYELKALYDKDGKCLKGDKEVAEIVKSFDWRHGPEIIAVDQAMGGLFSGAGGGQTYGGIIEMRLDTLETREVNSYVEEINDEDHPEATFNDENLL